MNLLNNIINNFFFLESDFTGVTIDIFGIVNFFSHFFIALAIFTLFYLVGKLVTRRFFKKQIEFDFFISIGLGYILIGTGIAILGVFSLLRKEIILLYLLGLIVLVVNKFIKLLKYKKIKFLLKKLASIKINFIHVGVALFVFIAFLRLLTPEIVEDGYHTDLPSFYLTTGTAMHESKEPLHVIPYAQLPEMIYLIPIFLGDKEAARFIHFGFYLVTIVLLFYIANKNYRFMKFAPLLFASTPLVIRYTSTQHTDFFMVFTFLLSAIILERRLSKKLIILSGIFFGAVLSAKTWMLVYLPAFLLYLFLLNKKNDLKKHVTFFIIFILSIFLTAAVWYIRAYLITGNPIYPIFAKVTYLETNSIAINPSIFSYFGFNVNLFDYKSLIVFSPLFFLSLIFSFINIKETIEKVKKSLLFKVFVILLIEILFINLFLPRYLLPYYTLSCLFVSVGLTITIPRHAIIKYISYGGAVIIFLYYLITTLFVLPYGLGWADQNKYLTRVLSRDNASYYDFDHLFDKWISKKDLVATYGIGSYYYADFSYVDIGYIFDDTHRDFDLLKKRKTTKLLIKGGDITWFCKQLDLINCKTDKVKLLASYPQDSKKYNLYLLQ